MPPIERDMPREADRALKHQHSASSDYGRALVPMWDSSDPDRAPPPLPLNPQSPSIGTSRAGTSSAIQSAHAALTEKARESALVPHLAKRVTDLSPERPMAKTSQHRRMQSLQTGTVKDLSLMIEGGRDSQSSTPRSPEKSDRPSTPSRSRDPFVDDRDDKALVASPRPGPSLTPIIRPTVRRPHQSILGENTPPQSATMLALQNMSTPTPKEPEAPLANITNGSTALVRAPQALESLSSQILSLTSIATSLQKDMSLLSRRSRDNATDLLSLKEATNARDEDIRKSLRDLISEAKARASTRDAYGGNLLLEARAHSSSPPATSKAMRPFSLPRIPSPNSFAASLDRETSVSTPSLCHDAAASIALLEKILHEMGTREGQDTLLARLKELSDNLAGLASSEKVDELLRFVKSNQQHAVVPVAGGGGGSGGFGRSRNFSFDEDDDNARPRELGYGQNGPTTARVSRLLRGDSRRSSAPVPNAAGIVNEDVLKVIHTVKDSVAQGGGLTAEVKALVRELRGEVLGMGREIGRRLEESSAKKTGKEDAASKADMANIIDESLAELKQHMNQLLREHRRQSSASTHSKSSAEFDKLNSTIRAALLESQAHKPSRGQDLSRSDVMHAIKEAWETYKPELEARNVGMGREEILACLQEGFEAYAPRDPQPVGATREEVFKAVVEGLRHFVPPRVDTPASLSRDEILEAVRECLEEFEFPVAPSAIGAEISKEDMAEAVRQGLGSFDFPAGGSRGVDLSRDDVLDAVRDTLKEELHSHKHSSQSALVPATGHDDEILNRLHEIMTSMHEEFIAVSEEAKQNVAANGRDTEQVLDATKDGFEKLRTDMQAYVDRVSGELGQKEFMVNLVERLDSFRSDVGDLVAKSSRDMLRSEVEELRDAVNSSLVPSGPQGSHTEILEALQDGLTSLRTEIGSRPVAGITEILDALHEGLGDLRSSIDKLHDKPTDLTANDEILDALKHGLESVRSDIDVLREESKNDKALAKVGDNAVITTDTLKHDDIKNLEVLITQLRIKVEAMDPTPPPVSESLAKEDVAQMEELLRNVQESVENVQESVAGMSTNRGAPASSDAASREDVQAIETILRNTKACLDDLIDGEQAVRKDHIDALETIILETKGSLADLATQLEALSRKEDITMVESLVTQVVASFDEMKERHEKAFEDPEKVTKTDVDALEVVCLEIKNHIEQIVKADLAALPCKDDLKGIETLVKEFKDRIDIHAASNVKAFEERQAETVGVSDRVTEVKTFLEEFQGVVKEKLEQGAQGVDAINKLLETMGETLGKNGAIGDDLRDMFETMKSEFEESKAGVVGAKLDADEKFQQTTDTITTKFDERIGELLTKYDDFQLVLDERATKGEARDIELEAAVVGTKAVADELKTLIDTLGSAVTDSLEKMEEASKTVFDRVEDLVNKSEENHSDHKAEHQMTRDQVREAIGIAEGVQGHVVEYQPKILEAVKDVLLIVGQHFEHSKSTAVNIQEKIEEAKPPEQPLLPEPEKYDDSAVQEKLNKLVDHSEVAGEAFSRLDTLDKVHQQVMATAADISEFIAAQTQRIADDHEDREKTLQDTTAALERKLAEKEQTEASVASLKEEEVKVKESIETRLKEAEEHKATILQNLKEEEERLKESFAQRRKEEEQHRAGTLERLRQEEEQLKERIANRLREEEERKVNILQSLQEEEGRLKSSLLGLRSEQEGLTRQKIRLAGDMSSLETALRLRREELHDMEARAEALEGRILDRVMDHSRVLLMTKAGKANATADAMSRKRVPAKKAAPATSPTAPEKPVHQNKAKSAAITMAAMASNRSLAVPPSGGSGPAARRILSLSQITSNVPAGGFKRSQSVRTHGGAGQMRKSSWAGGRAPTAAAPGIAAAKGYGDLGREVDKENMLLKESDEENEHDDDEAFALVPAGMVPSSNDSIVDSEPDVADDAGAVVLAGGHGTAQGDDADPPSDTETLRRSSRGTTVMTGTESYTGTEGEYSDDDDERSDWTESIVSGADGAESVFSADETGGNEVVLFEG